MVLAQNWSFFQLCFFRQYMPGKCLLRYSTTKKRLSSLQKQEVKKVEKLTFFQRGESMVLVRSPVVVKKWPCLQLFFFRQYRPGNYLLLYSGTKKRLSRLENQEVEIVEKSTFFQRGWPMVFVQKWPFFQLCFFRQYRPGKYLSRYSRTKKRLFGL